MSRTMSNHRFFRSDLRASTLRASQDDVGARTGADDLWVLPKSVLGPSEDASRATVARVALGNSTRTRVCFPPRAFSTRSAGCTMLTQHRTPPDINTAGILVPFKLPSAAAADGNRTRFPAGPLGRSQQS